MKYAWDSSGAHAPFCVAASRKKLMDLVATISVSHTYRSINRKKCWLLKIFLAITFLLGGKLGHIVPRSDFLASSFTPSETLTPVGVGKPFQFEKVPYYHLHIVADLHLHLPLSSFYSNPSFLSSCIFIEHPHPIQDRHQALHQVWSDYYLPELLVNKKYWFKAATYITSRNRNSKVLWFYQKDLDDRYIPFIGDIR